MDFYNLTEQIRLADVFDVLVCAVLIYAVARWLRRRASYAVVVTGLAAVALYAAARYFEMFLTLQVFRIALPAVLIILVVVFQDDLRRAVERFGSWRPWNRKGKALTSKVIDMLLEAVTEMAQNRVGALIVLRGREVLEHHYHGGIPLGGQVSVPLLLSIFNPETPGHDGAIIVSGSQIERFAVHLPLSSNHESIGPGGTRHAAGLGLAERCDALVIIVSEERGTVSVARERRLHVLERPENLRDHINRFLAQTDARQREKPYRWITRHPELKLASLALAVIFWFTWVYRTDVVQQSFDDIPVLIENLPEGWEVETIRPDKVQVRISGPKRAFDFLEKEDLAITLDLSEPEEGTDSVSVTDERLRLPPGLSLSQSEPEQIRLRLHQVRQIELPIRVRQIGNVPAGYQIGEISVRPPKLKVIVPVEGNESPAAVTVTLDWNQIEFDARPLRLTRNVMLPEGVRRQPNEPEKVELTVPWQQESPDTKTDSESPSP